MKKSIFCIASLFSSLLFADPSGNVAAPRVIEKGFFIPRNCKVSARAGYEGNFVFDGHMRQDVEGSGNVDRYTQMVNAGTITLNGADRLDVYGVFGASQTCAEWRFADTANRIRNVHMETAHGFLWAVGARVVFFESGPWSLGLNGRYSSTQNHLQWLTIDGLNASVNGVTFDQSVWQLNLGAAYHIDLFTPYVAINYLNVRSSMGTMSTAIAKQNSRSNHFENKMPVGLNLGCTLSTGKYFMLNVEARVVSEEAISLSGEFRF